MKKRFFLIMLYSIVFNLQINSQDIKDCLNSDYRYLLQRAWDESNNIQFVEKSNVYLKELSRIQPECNNFIVREIEQNNIKKNAIKYINTNTYPFSFAFSNFMRNQKEFTDGIQVAIDDGVSELKTIMEKLTIREGQIPILIIVEFEDNSLTEKIISEKREKYFSYIFKNLEGIYYYATYNRIEHNEILEDIPLSNKILEEETLEKIYKKVMSIDSWNKLFIIRLTEKKILKDQSIYSSIDSNNEYDNQKFITMDLFKISESLDPTKKIHSHLLASADVTGVRTDYYYYKSAILVFIGTIIFIILFLYLLSLKSQIRLEDYFQKDSSNIWLHYFGIIFINAILLFIITSFLYPYNRFFEKIIGEWLEVSSRSSLALISLSLFSLLLFYLVFSYILASKVLDSYFLLKEIYGLPLLFGMSGYGIVLSIIYKISVFENLYSIFNYSNQNYFYIINISFYSILFIFSFFSIGSLVQEYLKLDSINKKFYFLNESSSSKGKESEFSIKVKENILTINLLKSISLISLLGFLIYLDFFLIQIMKSDIDKLANLWKSIYLNIPFFLSFTTFIFLKINSKDFNLDEQKYFSEIDYEKIRDEDEFKQYFLSQNDEFRFKFDDIKIKQNHNFIFINGVERSGKKEIVRKIINQFKTKTNLKVINLNFAEKLADENELSKFIEIGKFKIPEISVIQRSREFGNNFHEKSKSPLLKIIEKIPFIGEPLKIIISSDKIYDENKNNEDLIKDVSKIYIDFMKSYVRKETPKNSIALVIENIHCCNEPSFTILLNLLNEFKIEKVEENDKNKDKNQGKDKLKLLDNAIKKNIFIILTGKLDSDFIREDNINIDFLKISKKFKNKFKLNLNFKAIYNFTIYNTKGLNLTDFKKVMRDNYSFAQTSFNDYFIDKIYYTLKIKDLIYLHDVNLTLRHIYKYNRTLFEFDPSINKIFVKEIIDVIHLHPDIILKISETIELLTKEEEHFVLATTQLHDWFTLEQISYTLGLKEDKLEYLLFSISEKIPELYIYKDNKYFRINKKIREYFKTEVLSKYPDGSISDLKLNLFAKNFIKNYNPQKFETINDLKKLSFFSFYLDDHNEILKLNSFYIREAYFNVSDRLKVFSVLKKLDKDIVLNCNEKMKDEYLYLVSIHYSYKKSFSDQSIFKNINKIINSKGNPNPIKFLSIVLMNYTFKDQLDLSKGKKYFDKKVDKVKQNLFLNFSNLIKFNNLENRLIIKGWIIFLISYFTKNYLISTDKIYKNIYEELIKSVKDTLPIQKEIDDILFGKTDEGYFISHKSIHEYCNQEINLIIQEHKNSNFNQDQKYIQTDMEILTKELEHIKIRIDNTHFELYVRDLPNYGNIKNDTYLKSDMESKFKTSIQLSKKLKNLTGLAITENLFSYYYYYFKQFEKALKHNEESFKRNQEIKDYSGMINSHESKIMILNEFLKMNERDDLTKKVKITSDELEIFKSHNPIKELKKDQT